MQLVTCLTTDACLTADPGVASSIPARSHTFVKIDHEIISMVILLPSIDSFKKGCLCLCFFCLVFAMCASVYMCLVVTCWERADLLALVCGV